jgi:alkylation response protein AidB-like acyl-CoA dehydrogenase
MVSTSAELHPPAPHDAARALTEAISGYADQTQRERRLPAPLVATLAEAGLFRLCVPRALGGGEVDVASMVRTIEEVSYADGSVGWCVMIGATSAVVSAYLDQDTAREVYGDQRVVTGGVFAPHAKALVVDGGYRVTGQWPFASGCQHCGWLMGGSLIIGDDGPRRLPNGNPDSRMMLFPAAEARVIDTWDVSGLRGTGSHDIAITDLFVPRRCSVSLLTDRPRHDGPLYAFPVFGLLALGIAGVALGIARHAIDQLTLLATGKTPTGARRKLAERPSVQSELAQAEARLRSARAFLLETVAETWRSAVVEGAISVQQRALLRLAATHATRSSATVVDAMYDAGGGSSIYSSNPLQRCFRDVHVVTQHMMVGPMTLELSGRLLLGLGTDTSML